MVVLVTSMGCRASKVDDLPLVIRCRERKRLIKSAADYRYDLSSSHLAYFHSLKDIGYALSRFVDEQLVIPSPPASSSSPVLTLPSDLAKSKNNGSMSSHSGSISHVHIVDGDDEDSGSESSSVDDHIHEHEHDGGGGSRFRNEPPSYPSLHRSHEYNEMRPNQTNWGDSYEMNRGGNMPYQPPWGEPYVVNLPALQYQPPWGLNQANWGGGDPYVMNQSASQFQSPWGQYQENFETYNGYGGNSYSNSNQYVSYMRKSAPASHTVIHQEEVRGFQETSEWIDPRHYDPYGSGYGYGFSYGRAMPPPQEPKKPKSPPPPPPPPPQAVVSDYFSFFDSYDNEYHGYGYGYGYESMGSSPDSSEVRKMEGIPDLEEETETESHVEEVVKMKSFSTKRNVDEGKDDFEDSSWTEPSSSTEDSSRSIPPGKHEGAAKRVRVKSTSNSVPPENKEGGHSVNTEVDKHSSDTIVSQSMEEGYEGKKGFHFDMDEGSIQGLESSNLSSLTTLSPHGSRDLHEVVNEIKDEFEVAFSFGKEVALMLEAGKLPYQSKFAVLKEILSKIFYPLASTNHPAQSVRPYSQVTNLAGSYNVDAVQDVRPDTLSSTLEKLYVWEKKLYKEVKGEERLRVIYEKMCKRLDELDAKGAESSKIDATQAAIRRLTTKLNVSIKAIDAISCEIDKVRDKELQPQVSELIYGLIRMWQAIIKCHRKQFEAIMESRSRTLRANTTLERDSSLRTTLELEAGLVTWAQHFNNWINAQRSYVDSLNGWLLQCVDHKPEVTIDGEVPYSPGRLGAPPIFIICNDWHREIKNVSQERVSKAMNNFALNLRQLLERQDDIQRLMLKKEYLAKDFARRSQNLGPDKTHGSMVPSEDRVSLDYKAAMKLVGNSGSSSLQGGVIPIFKALESFTCDALKAHEQVRLV